jgi:class 3 adenylate cyclase
MSLAIRERVGSIAQTWSRRGYALGLGIGIAQGFATLGAIGFDGRWDYGAIGTVTNLAARLCGEAAANEILISRPVHAQLEALLDVDAPQSLVLKGFQRPVDCFRVLGMKAPTR